MNLNLISDALYDILIKSLIYWLHSNEMCNLESNADFPIPGAEFIMKTIIPTSKILTNDITLN